MPCRNSSEKLSTTVDDTPSALSPILVTATLNVDLGRRPVQRTAVVTLGSWSPNQARPLAGSPKLMKRYEV